MAVALSGNREILHAARFPPSAEERQETLVQPAAPLVTVPPDGLDFDEVVGEFERSLLNQALALTGGNKSQAADLFASSAPHCSPSSRLSRSPALALVANPDQKFFIRQGSTRRGPPGG